jgi:hypothetical protein
MKRCPSALPIHKLVIQYDILKISARPIRLVGRRRRRGRQTQGKRFFTHGIILSYDIIIWRQNRKTIRRQLEETGMSMTSCVQAGADHQAALQDGRPLVTHSSDVTDHVDHPGIPECDAIRQRGLQMQFEP